MKKLFLLFLTCLPCVAADSIIIPIIKSNNVVQLTGALITATNVHGTNYWLDFGMISNKYPVVYQSIRATNHVRFINVTNCDMWDMLSVNVLASGGNFTIGIPTNLPHVTTNGLTLSGGHWTLNLLSGNEFRMTIQSNAVTLSTLWSTFGQ